MKKNLIILGVFLFIGCNQSDRFTDDITIVGYVSSKTIINVRYLSKKSYVTLNSPPFKPIKKSIVSISDGENNSTLALIQDDGTSWFQDTANVFHPVAGQEFSLTVKIGERTFNASTTVPPQPRVLNPDTVDVFPVRTIVQGLPVDRVDLTVRAQTGVGANCMRIFSASSSDSYVRPNMRYTLNDSATFTFLTDTTTTWMIASTSVNVLDENSSKSDYLDFNSLVLVTDLDSSAVPYIQQMEEAGLEGRSSFDGALGFFGSRSYNNKTFILRVRR